MRKFGQRQAVRRRRTHHVKIILFVLVNLLGSNLSQAQRLIGDYLARAGGLLRDRNMPVAFKRLLLFASSSTAAAVMSSVVSALIEPPHSASRMDWFFASLGGYCQNMGNSLDIRQTQGNDPMVDVKMIGVSLNVEMLAGGLAYGPLGPQLGYLLFREVASAQEARMAGRSRADADQSDARLARP
jgi:hypothetical protein